MFFFVVFKQKTAYEMRISDWSSDVCSSDLATVATVHRSQGGGTGGNSSSHFGLSFLVVGFNEPGAILIPGNSWHLTHSSNHDVSLPPQGCSHALDVVSPVKRSRPASVTWWW